MSSAVFPSLVGQALEITRTPVWDTTVQTNTSGKELRIANQTYPVYQWDVSFEVLRQGPVNGSTYAELAQLMGFFNARQGQFDSFLYQDPDDNAVTAQQLATGDGGTKAFQLVRAFGGYLDPVLAPNAVSTVYVNGGSVTGWSVTNWGTASPGVLTLASAPAAGAVVTADFTFYWPCRFTDDKFPLTRMMPGLYAGKKLSFQSVKS